MTANAQRALKLLAGVLGDCEFQTKRMAELAGADFLTVTELTDTLVREENLSFRDAHHLVSKAVRALDGKYSVEAMADEISRSVNLTHEKVRTALAPRNFVEVRTIPGGPGALKSVFADTEAEEAGVEVWIGHKDALLASYRETLRQLSQNAAQ